MTKFAVVGSGPTSAISAQYLVKQGHEVVLFDVGLVYDGPMSILKGDGFIKKFKGSDFMYRILDNYQIQSDSNCEIKASNALGGLSNVWGATVSSFGLNDLDGWLELGSELKSNLSEVFREMGVVSEIETVDKLDKFFYSNPARNFLNNQTNFIYQNYLKHRNYFDSSELFLSKAKLAININKNMTDNSCILCSRCMDGCEINSIFNSKDVIAGLNEFKNFQYLSPCLVESISESDQGVKIIYKNVKTEQIIETENFNAVLLGAGCIQTLKILNNSKLIRGSEVLIHESQKYYFPIICRKAFDGNGTISLTHLYVRGYEDDGVSLHMQIYPGRPHLDNFLLQKFGFLSKFFINFFGYFINHILIGCVYLNSNSSGKIKATIEGDVIRLDSIERKDCNRIYRKFIKKLNSMSIKLGIFIPPFVIKAKLGHSQHFGGTFPMDNKNQPACNVTDHFGRLSAKGNIYLIDSSVMPNIPATPSTAIVCANALRISKYLSTRYS